jgi:uncharacterized repeat protein (TIGR01451 family)
MGADPVITPHGSGLFTATWTFSDQDDFNTSEILIESFEASLQSYDYYFNQTSKDDFNRAELDNVTTTDTPETTIVWEDNFLIDNGWEHGIIENRGGPEQWERGSPSGESSFVILPSNTPLWGINLSGKYEDDDGTPDDTYLQSPVSTVINLSQSENTTINLLHYYIFEDGKDGGVVEVSVDNGDTWNLISTPGYDKRINSSQNSLNGKYAFTGDSKGWVNDEFEIRLYDGKPSFLIRFRFATDGFGSDFGWYIDKIEITSTTYSDGETELKSEKIKIGNPPDNIYPSASNRTIIDINNPVESNGILTEWTVYTPNEGTGKMKIFRDNDTEFTFIDETELEHIIPGQVTSFECYIEVKAGDYIGWYGETADIWSNSIGSAYIKEGDLNESILKTNLTSEIIAISINAEGIFRYYSGSIVSQVFNAKSLAAWDKLKWNENTSNNAVDIMIKTRTGNTLFPDESWSEWSDKYQDPDGSTIKNPPAKYIQYQANFTTSQQPFTPILFDISISYCKYSPLGEIETRDLIPEDTVVQWGEFSVTEELNGQQKIEYYYSLDSGDTWEPKPEDDDFFSISVFEGKIRFKAILSTENTTISPVLSEMSLEYSSATPEMELIIQSDKKTVQPGDIITFEIIYNNNGIGNAKDVSIAFMMDANLTYKGDTAPVESTREGDNVRKWHLVLVEPASKSFFVDTKVNDVEDGSTISVYASLNYTDIGGNSYPGVSSETVDVKVKTVQDLLPYYMLTAVIVAIILITFMFFVTQRYRTANEGEERIAVGDVERGIGYLVMEENPKKSYTLFSELIDEGNSGLCITRTYPERVKSNYIFENVSILWLSRRGDSDSILPTNLGAIVSNSKEFMSKNENSAILLDGLEYLIVHNDFEKVLKLVHALNELAALNKSILLLPLNFKTLEEGKIALLKRDLKMLG